MHEALALPLTACCEQIHVEGFNVKINVRGAVKECIHEGEGQGQTQAACVNRILT